MKSTNSGEKTASVLSSQTQYRVRTAECYSNLTTRRPKGSALCAVISPSVLSTTLDQQVSTSKQLGIQDNTMRLTATSIRDLIKNRNLPLISSPDGFTDERLNSIEGSCFDLHLQEGVSLVRTTSSPYLDATSALSLRRQRCLPGSGSTRATLKRSRLTPGHYGRAQRICSSRWRRSICRLIYGQKSRAEQVTLGRG